MSRRKHDHDFLAGDTVATSDRHSTDPDCGRPDINGVTADGMWFDLVQSDVGRIWVLGDFLNSMGFVADFIRDMDHKAPHIVSVVPGNHDREMHDCEFLFASYTEELEFLHREFNALLAHGHQADPFWSVATDRPGLRRWLGDKIIDRASKIETKHPTFDDKGMGLLHWVNDKLLPRGNRMGREQYWDWVAKVADEHPAIDYVIHGHSHRAGMWDVEVEQIMLDGGRATKIVREVDLGGWPPAHRDHPLGWYRKGESAPCVWSFEKKALFRWHHDCVEWLAGEKVEE